MHRFSFSFFHVILIAGMAFFAPAEVFAAQLSLSAAVSPTVGTTFPLDVLADPQGESVNSVEASVRFDANRYRFSGYVAADGAIRVWVSPPAEIRPGEIHFSGVILGGIERAYDPHRPDDHRVAVARLLLTPIATGEGSFSISRATLLANDGAGSALSVATDDLSVTAKEASSSQAAVSPDIAPPLPFSIELVARSTFDRSPRLAVFRAIDEESGIRDYEVRINNGKSVGSNGSYELPRRLFPYTLTARAIDFAGNHRDAQLRVGGSNGGASIMIAAALLVGIVWYRQRRHRRQSFSP